MTERAHQKTLAQVKVAVVIPTLNERHGIGSVMDKTRESLRDIPHDIVVVDGHSTDGTDKIAMELQAKVIYQEGKGYGDALLSGFNYSLQHLNPNVIFMIDADGTYDPADMIKMLRVITEGGYDLVIGNRFQGIERAAMPLTNQIGNKILSWMMRKTLKISAKDTQCGLRGFRADLIKKLDLRTSGMPFTTEMLVEASRVRARIAEVPVTYRQRIGHAKLDPFRDGFRILATILRLYRDFEPLLFFGGIGSVLTLAGLVIGFSVLIEWLTTGAITRLASTMLSAMLMLSGFQLFILGLLADMVKDVKRAIRLQTRF